MEPNHGISHERAAFRAEATLGQHCITILLGTWLLLGIFVDGYAHRHDVLETFFTPWHAILYSGFIASACWMTGIVYRNRVRNGGSWMSCIPRGYGAGLCGVAIFLCGGLADMVWHTIFGIEKDTAALLSPSHLLLLVGSLLLLSAPYQAAMSKQGECNIGWRLFFPPFLSITLAAAAAGFFLMYTWMFHYNLPSAKSIEWLQSEYGLWLITINNEHRGLSYILINTLLFMIPLFLLMKRWIVPIGTMTLFLVITTTLNSSLDGFRHYPVILIAGAAGIAGDLLYRWLRPYERTWSYRVVAGAIPLMLWSLYFLWMHMTAGIGWEIELWTGAIVQAMLASIAVSLLTISSPRNGRYA